jgi:hypothetical protein
MVSAAVLSLLAAAALAQDGAPPPRATAEAVARATIVNPATFRIDVDLRPTLTHGEAASGKIRPRATERPCPLPEARSCPAIVFDLP